MKSKYLPSRRLTAASGGLIFMSGVSLTLPALGQKLFYEGFDVLPLGPNVEEASVGAKVWTKTPPTGWSIDDSGMPGFGQPDYADRDGRREWAGWSFADVKWWPTVDNQRRVEFTLASGAAAIADPDEWDDAGHYPGLYNSFLKTPSISVAGKAANSLVLIFDSSWRPEGHDDGQPNFPVDENGRPTNNQTATIKAQWDDGTPVEVVKWDSDSESATYKADGEFINEAALVVLNNPAGARTLTLTFGMTEAANDWWWAVDNIAVGEPPLLAGISSTGVGFTTRIREALGKTVSESPAPTAKLDGTAVVVTTSRDGDTVFVSRDQAPKIFVPGSTHTVEVTYRTSDGRQISDSLSFVAPTYTTVAATPTTLTVNLSETSYLTVDESKGITLELDGAPAAVASIKRDDLAAADGSDAPDRIVVSHTFAALPASGSSHTLKVKFTTKDAQVVEETTTFKAAEYVTLPPTLGTALGTGAEAGMRWRTHQLAAGRSASNVATVEKQLLGELGASSHDTSGQNAQGYFDIDYVNFEQTGADAGNFNASASAAELAVGDLGVPGIPGQDANNANDYVAGESLAYLALPSAGLYTMTVNSDDGFQVSVGNTNNPAFLVLGKYDATRSAGNSTFYFRAEQPGLYLFRMLWFEGTGGASVEWFTTDATGKSALVNGPATGVTPLRAFRRRTVAEPALPVTTPTIGIAAQGGKAVITYSGTLQAADTANGPYSAVSGATSPYSVTPTGTGKFYRAQQ